MYGFELDKLARQYGLQSPTAPVYTGVAKPTDTTSSTYQADLAKYNADQAAFANYQNEYNRRLQQTPMYSQPQFQSPTTQSVGYKTLLGNSPIPQHGTSQYETYVNNINDYLAQHPGISQQDLQDLLNKYGYNRYDLLNATGSWWGNALNNPAYSGVTTTVNGGKGNDTITGGGTNDTITGGGTNDTITGGGTNDTITGGGTNDTITGGGTNDTITGTGTDTTTGGGTNDTITGGGTNDTITGTGTDTTTGGGTNDTITGTGTDTTTGGGTNDTITGTGTDTTTGGTGTDTGTSTITGGTGTGTDTGTSTITGGTGTDTGTNNSTVTGGTGNDTVTNNSTVTGTDTVTGGIDTGTGTDTTLSDLTKKYGTENFTGKQITDWVNQQIKDNPNTAAKTIADAAAKYGITSDQLAELTYANDKQYTAQEIANYLNPTTNNQTTSSTTNTTTNTGTNFDTITGGTGTDTSTDTTLSDLTNKYYGNQNFTAQQVTDWVNQQMKDNPDTAAKTIAEVAAKYGITNDQLAELTYANDKQYTAQEIANYLNPTTNNQTTSTTTGTTTNTGADTATNNQTAINPNNVTWVDLTNWQPPTTSTGSQNIGNTSVSSLIDSIVNYFSGNNSTSDGHWEGSGVGIVPSDSSQPWVNDWTTYKWVPGAGESNVNPSVISSLNDIRSSKGTDTISGSELGGYGSSMTSKVSGEMPNSVTLDSFNKNAADIANKTGVSLEQAKQIYTDALNKAGVKVSASDTVTQNNNVGDTGAPNVNSTNVNNTVSNTNVNTGNIGTNDVGTSVLNDGANVIRALINGALPSTLATGIEAQLRSWLGDETYDQAKYDILTNNANFNYANPDVSKALQAAGLLGSTVITGGPGPLDAIKLNDIINSDYASNLKSYPYLNTNPWDTSKPKDGNVVSDVVSGLQDSLSNVLGKVDSVITPDTDVSMPDNNIKTYGSSNLTAQQIKDTVNAFNSIGDSESIARLAKEYGLTPQDVAEASGYNIANTAPTSEPNVSNDANYQMAFDLGLEKSYDPNFDYVNLFYNHGYADVNGNPYTDNYAGSNTYGSPVFNTPWGSSFLGNFDYNPNQSTPQGDVTIGDIIPVDAGSNTWTSGNYGSNTWTPSFDFSNTWTPTSLWNDFGNLFSDWFAKGGHVDAKKYAQGGEVNKLDNLVRKYDPSMFEQNRFGTIQTWPTPPTPVDVAPVPTPTRPFDITSWPTPPMPGEPPKSEPIYDDFIPRGGITVTPTLPPVHEPIYDDFIPRYGNQGFTGQQITDWVNQQMKDNPNTAARNIAEAAGKYGITNDQLAGLTYAGGKTYTAQEIGNYLGNAFPRPTPPVPVEPPMPTQPPLPTPVIDNFIPRGGITVTPTQPPMHEPIYDDFIPRGGITVTPTLPPLPKPQYARGGEVNKLDQLARKYQPRRFELGGEVDDENTDLPVIPQARLNTQIEPSINDLNAKYSAENPFYQEYSAARKKAREENDLLRTALEKHLADQPMDKSEMYFRLAAALAAPTKTQGIGEPLSRVADALAESRASERAQRQANALTALKARQSMAELAGTEAKDIGQLFSKYASGTGSKSTFGKLAEDLGLKPGTPEYVAKVNEFQNQSNALTQAQSRNLAIAERRLALEEQKYGNDGLTPAQEQKALANASKDMQALEDTATKLQQLKQASTALSEHKGLPGISGVSGFLPSFPAGEAAQAQNAKEALDAKMTALGKAASAMSGSIGSMATQEWKILKDQVDVIDPVKLGVEGTKKRLADLNDYADATIARLTSQYQREHAPMIEKFPERLTPNLSSELDALRKKHPQQSGNQQ